MKENYQDFINQNCPQNFFAEIDNEELCLQDMIFNEDVTLAEQPVLNLPGNLLNHPELIDQSLYTQQHTGVANGYNLTLNTPVYMSGDVKCESETGSPLSYSEDQVNLTEIKNEENLNCLLANPLLVLSIIPWPGPYNFRVSIPAPDLQGVKPKWCFSDYLKKLYVARNIAFPVNITLDKFPVGAVLNMCPVFTKSSNRMVPVNRCPNCQLSDRNVASSYHVIQVEDRSALSTYYFCQNDRYMVSVPLGQPAPGDDSLNVFLKVCCNTSCVGGPNRKPFSILITLKFQDREIGRQVIDVKCCEGPLRDMATDETRELKTRASEMKGNNMDLVRQVANEVANTKRVKTSKKRKIAEITLVDTTDNAEGYETLKMPKKYVKRVKKYVNHLYMKDQLKKRKDENLQKYFLSATSESD